MENGIYIFTGHYGSGKTEVALNFALKSAKEGNKTLIVDLDVVNPYFRTKDAEPVLNAHGIRVMAPVYANTNLDIPALPAEIFSVFDMDDSVRIFDVGGDDDGAYALGQYKRFFDKTGYSMYFVANTRRPFTSDTEGLKEVYEGIERASRLRFTGIVNNTNLAEYTDEKVVMSGISSIKALADMKNVPVVMHSGTENAVRDLDDKFVIQTYLKKPWETA